MRIKVIATAAAAALLIAVAVVFAVTRRTAEVVVDPSITLRPPGLLVRDTTTGHLALVKADGVRTQSKARCARAYAAGNRAICLLTDPDAPSTFQLNVLDERLDVVRTLPINGVPTRARVSADGRMLAWTVFVSGDSYLTSGFSTRTGILDLQRDRLVSSLEEFTIDGQPPPTDANFWGVSVTRDDNTFYSTMATGEHFYLVRGDFAAGTITVLDDDVECPSLSPDNTRLVYKNRLPDLTWQLWVYDLATKQRTQLAEPGNVDDQAAWLDDRTVAYGKADPNSDQVNVWSLPADGSGAPTLLAENAESPAILR
jgi:dipeptidyl aminopeptidase/acylaminoacyl peptidase